MSRYARLVGIAVAVLLGTITPSSLAVMPRLIVKVHPGVVAGGSSVLLSVRVLRHRSNPARLGVPGATVTVAGHTLRTDAHGLVRLRVQFPCYGSVPVVARKRGFQPGQATILVLAAASSAAFTPMPIGCL
jgi:hypothetical protein